MQTYLNVDSAEYSAILQSSAKVNYLPCLCMFEGTNILQLARNTWLCTLFYTMLLPVLPLELHRYNKNGSQFYYNSIPNINLIDIQIILLDNLLYLK